MTIMFVNAGVDRAVPWTKPEDLPFNAMDPVAPMGNLPDDCFWAVFFDGEPKELDKSIHPGVLRMLIRHDDPKAPDDYKIE